MSISDELMSLEAGQNLEAELQDAARFVRERLKSGARAALEIGRRLQQLRNTVGATVFQRWLRSELAWSRSMSTKYMCVARAFEESAALENIQSSALYLLARKNVSPETRQEALRMAEEGRPVSRKTALELIRQHSEAPPRVTPPQGWKPIFNRATKLPLPDVLKLTMQLVQFVKKESAASA